MKARVLKWGNSLAVRIPRGAADVARLKEGDAIELTASEEGKLEVRRVSKVLSLSELVARITPENRHGEISSGVSVGKEPVEW
ncbi:MAG TPA: AbrB/MazE/SpoVT family DNA-binding domain-containing protein [Candidatus Angelobacter sp.]